MNVAREIVQFVPRLGVQSDGVADYATTLAAALSTGEQIDMWFLQGDPFEGGDDDSRAERSARVAERSAAKLIEALEALGEGNRGRERANVLVHYANYGFARRGCPFWLVDGLEQWKRRNAGARLITMFHELYASGPPWRSSFWLSPVQRHLAARLARLSDFGITSSELYRRRLARWAPAKQRQIMVRPVFSTIGEPAKSMPWDARQPRLAVLGRAGTEARAFGQHRQALATMARALGIEEIIDIGPRSQPVPSEVAGIKVRSTGQLPREEVSRVLSSCRAGFLDYPSDVLGKSTVFAAYCAHGVVPGITHVRGAGLDGLREGEHFLLARAQEASAPPSQSILENISKTAFDWYRSHSVGVQAAALSGILK